MKSPFILILGIPLLMFVAVIYMQKQRQQKLKVSGSVVKLKLLKSLPRYKKLERREKIVKLISWIALGVVSVSLLAVASRPTTAKTVNDKQLGLDVMVVLDTSGSMKQYFKSVGVSLGNMVNQFKTDRLGMIVFSGEAQQVLPLTDDYTEIKSVADYMANHDPEDFSYHYAYGTRGGTDISSGLYLASARMANLPAQRTKVVLLISDGEQTSSSKDDPNGTQPTVTSSVINAADLLGKNKTRVYSIAVTGDGGPAGDFATGRDLLEEVAKRSSGKVYAATDSNSAKEVFGEINQLLRREIDGQLSTVAYETPWTWLFIAFLGLTIYLIASSRRFDGGIV